MIKLFEMFSGYGGASFALKKAGIPFECVGYSEIDKYAVECYNKNHNYDISDDGKIVVPYKNFGDCTKINPKEIPDFDLLTGGFPCQSFSNAGKGLGELDTRGTLFNEIIRIAEVKKPRYMLLENVRGLTSKKHKKTFDKILSELRRIGYYVKWYIKNSREHGIPQNRERVWIVCFRNIYEHNAFYGVKKEELRLFLKDILETNVDEKYYLSDEQVKRLLSPDVSSFRSRNIIKGNVCQTLQSAMSHGNTIPLIFDVYNSKIKEDGICPTLTEPHHNNLRLIEPFLPIKNATKRGYIEGVPGDGVNLDFPTSNTRRGRVIKDCCGALQCNDGRGVITNDFRIRKLTPTECFRLMGFLDDNINLDGLSNTQKYKLAGNGWDINLVSKIFTSLFVHNENNNQHIKSRGKDKDESLSDVANVGSVDKYPGIAGSHNLKKHNYSQQPDVKENSPSLGGGESASGVDKNNSDGCVERGSSSQYPPAETLNKKKSNYPELKNYILGKTSSRKIKRTADTHGEAKK